MIGLWGSAIHICYTYISSYTGIHHVSYTAAVQEIHGVWFDLVFVLFLHSIHIIQTSYVLLNRIAAGLSPYPRTAV